MKKIKLTRCLCMLLCLFMFVACQNEPANGTESSTQPPEQGAQRYEPSANELLLVADGQAYCSIVRPKRISKDLLTCCSELPDAIHKSTGVEVQMIADDRQVSEGTVEILIGDTNRTESAEAKEKLGKCEYSISVINGKVVVAAFDDVILESAIRELINLINLKPEQLKNGIWTFPLTYRKQFDGSDYPYNAYISKGYELTSEFTAIPQLTTPFGTTSKGDKIPWVQGGCTDGTYYYYFMITENSVKPTKCVIMKFDMKTKKRVQRSAELELGHANDAAYNPNTHTILVAEGGTTYHVIDPDTLTKKGEVTLANCGAISYDVDQKMYVAASFSKLYFYDDQFNLKKQISIKGLLSEYDNTAGKSATQGVTSDSKFLYYLEYWQSKTDPKDIRCYIAVYEIHTGNFVQRIPLYMGREVENIVIWDNSFYILCNNIGWSGAEGYQIKVVPKS